MLKSVKVLKLVCPACAIGLSVLEFFLEDGKISESKIKSMIKTEIAQEMTSSLIAGLLAKIKTAKMRLEDQDIKSAETLVLEALNIIVVHVKNKDLERWINEFHDIKNELIFMFHILVINKILMDTYQAVGVSISKDSRMEEFKKNNGIIKELALNKRKATLSRKLESESLHRTYSHYFFHDYLFNKHEDYYIVKGDGPGVARKNKYRKNYNNKIEIMNNQVVVSFEEYKKMALEKFERDIENVATENDIG